MSFRNCWSASRGARGALCTLTLLCAACSSASAGGGGASSGAGNAGSGSAGDAGTGGAGKGSGGAAGTANGGAAGSSGNGGSAGAPAGVCAALKLDRAVQAAGRDSDRFTWQDARCEPRVAALVRRGAGYLRQYSYSVDGAARVCTGTGANGWDGWGYTANHFGNTASTSQGVSGGTFAPQWVGRHHAIYEYKFTQSIAGRNVPVTVHWMFATGRDHPIYAITYDVSASPAGSLVADTRSPYGDIFWDGATTYTSVIAGVGWGDRYKFMTTQAPLTMNSAWDYRQPNQVPYVLVWATQPDAEMGAVQTQTHVQHDGGGYWHYANWGKTSANQTRADGQIGAMPPTWNWTYQICQYELCIEDPSCLNRTTGSHRLAWGANYGAIGGASPGSATYAAYGDDRQVTGHPYQSYSVFMVLGKHTAAPVFAQVADVEAVQGTTLTATQGSIDSDGPGGVGRTDRVRLAPAGWDARYATWRATAAGDALELQATVRTGTVKSPVLVIAGYSKASAPAVTLNGRNAVADVDYFLSLDSATRQVWITFRAGWTGTVRLGVR